MAVKEFFSMGGYAFYVWTAYGAVAVVLMANVIVPIMRQRRLLKELARRVSRERIREQDAG